MVIDLPVQLTREVEGVPAGTRGKVLEQLYRVRTTDGREVVVARGDVEFSSGK